MDGPLTAAARHLPNVLQHARHCKNIKKRIKRGKLVLTYHEFIPINLHISALQTDSNGETNENTR
jgi:hypothetical protein